MSCCDCAGDVPPWLQGWSEADVTGAAGALGAPHLFLLQSRKDGRLCVLGWRPWPIYQTQIVARGPWPLGQGLLLVESKTSCPVPFASCYSREPKTLLHWDRP